MWTVDGAKGSWVHGPNEEKAVVEFKPNGSACLEFKSQDWSRIPLNVLAAVLRANGYTVEEK